MSKSELLEEVEEQGEKASVVYDSDGILYLSCYKYRDTDDLELIYTDFWMRIKSIEAKIWETYEIEETVIALTSKKNFRHDLTDKWKADRKAKPESEMTEKQLEAHKESKKLRELVSKVKGLMHKRMSSSAYYNVSANELTEADDTCIDLAHKGWLVVSMDSDVIHQSPTPVFNYHKKHWNWQGDNSYEDIFYSIVHTTITGGHNGSFGVKGKGKVFADKFIEEIKVGDKSLVDWSDLFSTPEEAVLNWRVADCNQVKDGVLHLHTIETIGDMFEEVIGDVF